MIARPELILVAQSGYFAIEQGRAVPRSVLDGGSLVSFWVVTALTDVSARANLQLVFERHGDRGQSVAVYANLQVYGADQATKEATSAALKPLLERHFQAAPRSIRKLEALPQLVSK